MFCTKCNSQLDDDAIFCSACGNQITREELLEIERVSAANSFQSPETPVIRQTTDRDVPLFALQPTFLWALSFIYSIIGGIVLAVTASSAIPFMGKILALPIGILGVPVFLVMSWSANNRTEYTFYPEHVEYYEGFLTREFNSLRYQNVVEVTMTQGIFARLNNVGTIVLCTSGGNVSVANIAQHERMYKRVQELVKQAQS